MSESNASENNVSQAKLEGALEFADRVNRRQSWIILALVIAWMITVSIFIIYISLPVEEVSTATQSIDNIDSSEIHQTIGDSYGESEAK